MFTFNNTAVLKFDDAQTGNAASDVLVTVRAASTPTAGSGNLSIIYNINGVQIANPLTTDSKGNYTFQAVDGVYDIIINEGETNQVVLPSENFLDGADLANVYQPI
tara:strand:- start:262 stop:579 length:318 start_codon:yes stop_codon:yes gene_type:complete